MKFVIAPHNNKLAILASWNTKTEPGCEIVAMSIAEDHFTVRVERARVSGANRKGYWFIPFGNWSKETCKEAVKLMRRERDIHRIRMRAPDDEVRGWVERLARKQNTPQFKQDIMRSRKLAELRRQRGV